MMIFSRMHALPLAIASMMFMGLFVKMSNGANYSVVPFVNRRALGGVAGIVGAGGNAGAVLAGFLFKTSSLTYSGAFMILGIVVFACAPIAYVLRFSESDESATKVETEARLAGRLEAVGAGAPGD
jgi:NNP family nitrate/nitrite transporter-like MFS transporter